MDTIKGLVFQSFLCAPREFSPVWRYFFCTMIFILAFFPL